MIAALILVMSFTALAQFAIAQWRSMWMTVAAQPLSNCLQAATGISGDSISASDFELLAQTSEQLCPSPNEHNSWLREVRVYYRAIQKFDKFCAVKLAAPSRWAQNELKACSRYAAAVLDQRLNSNLAYASEVRSF